MSNWQPTTPLFMQQDREDSDSESPPNYTDAISTAVPFPSSFNLERQTFHETFQRAAQLHDRGPSFVRSTIDGQFLLTVVNLESTQTHGGDNLVNRIIATYRRISAVRTSWCISYSTLHRCVVLVLLSSIVLGAIMLLNAISISSIACATLPNMSLCQNLPLLAVHSLSNAHLHLPALIPTPHNPLAVLTSKTSRLAIDAHRFWIAMDNLVPQDGERAIADIVLQATATRNETGAMTARLESLLDLAVNLDKYARIGVHYDAPFSPSEHAMHIRSHINALILEIDEGMLGVSRATSMVIHLQDQVASARVSCAAQFDVAQHTMEGILTTVWYAPLTTRRNTENLLREAVLLSAVDVRLADIEDLAGGIRYRLELINVQLQLLRHGSVGYSSPTVLGIIVWCIGGSYQTSCTPQSKPPPPGSALLTPSMDLHADQDKNLVTATFELPGLAKENVQIDVKNGVLSVSGESAHLQRARQEGLLYPRAPLRQVLDVAPPPAGRQGLREQVLRRHRRHEYVEHDQIVRTLEVERCNEFEVEKRATQKALLGCLVNNLPAATEQAINVGASTPGDERGYFSNHGSRSPRSQHPLHVHRQQLVHDYHVRHLLSLYPSVSFNPSVTPSVPQPMQEQVFSVSSLSNMSALAYSVIPRFMATFLPYSCTRRPGRRRARSPIDADAQVVEGCAPLARDGGRAGGPLPDGLPNLLIFNKATRPICLLLTVVPTESLQGIVRYSPVDVFKLTYVTFEQMNASHLQENEAEGDPMWGRFFESLGAKEDTVSGSHYQTDCVSPPVLAKYVPHSVTGPESLHPASDCHGAPSYCYPHIV
ncbi:hypothetical protein C8Q76DRAFT_812023 [Earliella scabrosa]|nr:hypothetical protein C8Q76DRAFT_812023 [Earliella scabrosa]